MKLPYQTATVLIPLLVKSENYALLREVLVDRVIHLDAILACQPSLSKEQFKWLLVYYTLNIGILSNERMEIRTEYGRAILNHSATGSYLHSVRIFDEFKGKGHSNELMGKVMAVIMGMKGRHLLECPAKMVGFYKKYGWEVIDTYGLNVHVMQF